MSGRFPWLPAALVGLCLIAGSPAQAAATWPVSLHETAWYRITLLGQPSGYLCSQARIVHDEQGEELLEVVERQVVSLALGGETLQVVSDLSTQYQQDLTPRRWRMNMDKLGVLAEVSAERTDGSLRVVTVEGGQREEKVLSLPDSFGSEMQVFWAVTQGELQPGDSRRFAIFNPQISDLDMETVSVGPLEDLLVMGQVQPCYPLAITLERLATEMKIWLNQQGEIVRYHLPTLLGAVAERVSQAEALEELSPLVLADSVSLDRALPLSKLLKSVTLRAEVAAQDAAQVIPASSRQQVVAEEQGAARVTLLAQTRPTRTLPLPISDENLAEYLRPTTLVPIENPRLRELAYQIVGEESDSYRAAQALVRWVHNNLEKVKSEPRPISAVEILEQGWGDCSEHAVLTVALARVVGIPSRMVAGLACIDDAFFYHAWVELYVGEWVEMDPSWGEIGVDAGHLRLAESSLDAVSFARMSLETGRTLGTLSLEVLDFETGL